MGHRKVVGLKWSKALAKRPHCIPQGRARGVKALGVRYERQVAAQVLAQWPGAQHGVWWEFEDRNGHGYCQTDLLMPQGGKLLILECKYTWVEEARKQLDELYLPVVGLATGLPCLGVEVCKVLVSGMRGQVVRELGDAASFALPVWHNFAPPKVLARKSSASPLPCQVASH